MQTRISFKITFRKHSLYSKRFVLSRISLIYALDFLNMHCKTQEIDLKPGAIRNINGLKSFLKIWERVLTLSQWVNFTLLTK